MLHNFNSTDYIDTRVAACMTYSQPNHQNWTHFFLRSVITNHLLSLHNSTTRNQWVPVNCGTDLKINSGKWFSFDHSYSSVERVKLLEKKKNLVLKSASNWAHAIRAEKMGMFRSGLWLTNYHPSQMILLIVTIYFRASKLVFDSDRSNGGMAKLIHIGAFRGYARFVLIIGSAHCTD